MVKYLNKCEFDRCGRNSYRMLKKLKVGWFVAAGRERLDRTLITTVYDKNAKLKIE